MPDHGMAEEIAEELLYQTGRAMKAGDFDAFFEHFEIPQVLETVDGDMLITTVAGMCDVFDRVRQYYEDNDVRDVVRTVVSARFLDEESLGSTYVTRLLKSGGEPFRNPFPAYSVIKYLNGKWKIVSNSAAILDAPSHNRALLSADGTCIPAPKDL